MIQRTLLSVIPRSLRHYPAVGIVGSRQVGKTTLARMVQKNHKGKTLYLDLELTSDLKKLEDPELYLGQHADHLVIIDEIQQMPGLFPLLRALIDQRRRNGRFLILGSASPHLVKHASESLAGRISYHELQPLSVKEAGKGSGLIQKLWLRGGYPQSFLAGTDEISRNWREDFIKSHLQRDLPELGIHIPSVQLRRFLTMVAHCHGQLWNASNISRSLGVTVPTIKHYLDILEDTFIVRQLHPYYFNIKKRLIKSPKVYIRDSGLLHALLGIQTFDNLQAHPTLGNSWEGFVIEQIISSIPSHWEFYFLRTRAGAEIDLLLFTVAKKPIAVEIKYSLSPGVSKGFWQAYQDLGCRRGYIIYPGKESYDIGRGVRTLPLHKITDILK